jgi:hypothetical protein
LPWAPVNSLKRRRKTQKSPRMPHGENVRNGLNEAMLGLPPTKMMGRGDQVPGTDHDNRHETTELIHFWIHLHVHVCLMPMYILIQNPFHYDFYITNLDPSNWKLDLTLSTCMHFNSRARNFIWDPDPLQF